MTKRKASIALDESNQSNSTQDSSGASTNNNQSQQKQQTGSNNQNDNSNSSSTNKSKKERADNWSSAEIQVLHRGIDTRREIFYGPPSQATKKNRELAWEAITKEVNSVSTTPRSLSQVMKKFKNEKCRAKRKFVDKDGNCINDSTAPNAANDTTPGLSAQNHAEDNQQQPQQLQQPTHHMTNNEAISAPQPSINVVKLAPQNVAKTMIDLPGHVQQIQMPNDENMVLIVPEMDGLLSGMNIVSDGNGHHHLQRCSGNSTLQNHQHSHHGQHTIQSLNTTQSLSNGPMGNGMMARTIPAGSMCSLVYSTGGEVCGPEQHVPSNIAHGSLPANHINMNPQNLMHHRATIDQNQGQQQHHHHLHQQQQPQPQPPQQQQPHSHQQQQSQQHPQQQQQQQPASHHQQNFAHSHLTTTGTAAVTNSGGVAVESQLKNLLINLLFADGQHSSLPLTSQEHTKRGSDPLTVIANSLTKIESHLSKISKIASSLIGTNTNIHDNKNATPNQLANSNTINNLNSDGNNNNVGISSNSGSSNQRGSDA